MAYRTDIEELARADYRRGDLRGAERCQKQAIIQAQRKVSRDIEGSKAKLVSCYKFMVIIYCTDRRFDEAETAVRELLSIGEYFMEEAPSAGRYIKRSAYDELRMLAYRQNDPDKALEYDRLGYHVREQELSECPRECYEKLADTREHLGEIYDMQKNAECAEKYYRMAMDMYEKLAAECPRRYDADLAIVCYYCAEICGDEALYRRAYEIVREIPQNHDTYEILLKLRERYGDCE